MKMKNIYKFLFLAASVAWLVVSRIFYTENTSIEYWILVTIIYSIGIHWMYTYVFNLDMHYNVGKVKPSENKIARLLLFLAGGAICIAITCYV
jgi:hypothetical protein